MCIAGRRWGDCCRASEGGAGLRNGKSGDVDDGGEESKEEEEANGGDDDDSNEAIAIITKRAEATGLDGGGGTYEKA
jgi:hypothetical protein